MNIRLKIKINLPTALACVLLLFYSNVCYIIMYYVVFFYCNCIKFAHILLFPIETYWNENFHCNFLIGCELSFLLSLKTVNKTNHYHQVIQK